MSPNTKRRFKDLTLLLLSSLFVISILFTAIVVRIYRSYDLSSPEQLAQGKYNGLVLTDRRNQVFFTFHAPGPRTHVSIEEIPEHTWQAIVQAEDSSFFSHGGFTLTAITRSAIDNYIAKELVYGGSTISQQVIKNSVLTPEKTLRRKFRELILAVKLERIYTKGEILEMYVNSVYFGRGVIGIEEAAQAYFGKRARELTFDESILLAALLPAPARLSQLDSTTNELDNRLLAITERLRKRGFVSGVSADIKKLLIPADNLNTIPQNTIAPHFALTVREKLIEEHGEQAIAHGGWRVQTTIDLDLQEKSSKLVREHVKNLAGQDVSNAAIVVVDSRSHEILAMVGSVDWHQNDFGKINMALEPRQPGSSFKPFVYATALERSTINLDSLIQDKPIAYKTLTGNYRPANFNNRFRGVVKAEVALANSLNVPAVALLNAVGNEHVIAKAQGMGISTLPEEAKENLSLALGAHEVSPLEMTNAYAVFSNGGHYQPAKFIRKVWSDEEAVLGYNLPLSKRVVAKDVASKITATLSDQDLRKETFGSSLDTPFDAAIKTGTSQNYRDAWTLGYTDDYAVGVWVGNSDFSPMKNVTGTGGAASLWKNIFRILEQ